MRNTQLLSVRNLILLLQQAKNPDAAVVLCVDDFTYSAFNGTIDATHAPDREGVGCFILTLDPKSEVATALKEGCQDDVP